MPQIQINSANIVSFGFTATIDIYNKRIVFNTASLSQYTNPLNILGICFKIEGLGDLIIHDIDFTNPDILPGDSTYTLDLSSLGIPFIVGNTLNIIGEIKDQDGTIYSTPEAIKTICKPVKLNESGYVPGMFQIIPNCVDNVLTVKDFTPFIYDKKTPASKTVAGTLNYPTGSRDPIAFTGTPFSSNAVFTGEYIINCTTTATYDLGDDIYVTVTYKTNQRFPVTCQNFLGDISCCLVKLQKTYQENCDNAVGQKAKQQTYEVMLYIATGLVKQTTGQNAEAEVAAIKRILGCDCGTNSLGQNEMTPVNPATTSIVLIGAGGTSIGDPVVNADTKQFTIVSNIFQVIKGNTGDLAWTIAVDTSTTNVVRYKITFNYAVMAGYILTAIGASPTLITQLNNLITGTGANLTGLNGKCVIDLTNKDFVLSQNGLTGATAIVSVLINATIFTAPGGLFATDTVGISNWLTSLGLGTFTAIYSGGVLTVQSLANPNNVSSLTISTPGLTIAFQSSSTTLVQLFQAIIDYLCAITAAQVALAGNLKLLYFDYNAQIQPNNYTISNSQQEFNAGVAYSIYTLINRMNTLTAINCAVIKAIFPDNADSNFTGALARAYGIDQNGACVAFTTKQFALGIVQAIASYAEVKAIFCAISCLDPATCPDISNLNVGIIGTAIGFYSLTWATATASNQQVTLQFKLSSSSVWQTVSSSISIFPNGQINGSSPIQTPSLTPGETYNVRVFNNCGGSGKTVLQTVPTSGIFTADYLLDNIIYNICGVSPVTLYSNTSFGPGSIMYTDAGLTGLVTGYLYITPVSGGQIYNLDTATGVVGSDTGSNCNSGLAGTYILGNNAGTICGLSSTTLYTNGAFIIGGTLFLDAALTTPVTGSDFVVNVSDSNIYNLNTANGLIGSIVGACTSTPTSVRLDTTTNTLCANAPINVYTNAPFTTGVGLFNDAGLSSPVTGYNYVAYSGQIYNLNSVTGIVGTLLANSCGDTLIFNNSSGYTVSAIGNLGGFTLTGTVAPSANQTGTHGAFSSAIQVSVTGSGTGKVTLFRNSVPVSCRNITSAGTYTLDSVSVVVGDTLNVVVSNGIC